MHAGLHLVLVRGPAGGAPGTPAGYVYRVAGGGRRAGVVGRRPDAATVQAVATCLGLLVVDRASGAIPARAGAPALGLLLRDGSVRGAHGLLAAGAQWEVRRIAYGLVRHEMGYLWRLASTLRDGRAAAGVERVEAGHPLRNPRLEQYLAPEPPLASLLRDFRGAR
ncbi:MAG TPA: hypothetical protein VFQ76_03965 [Longimicrobiaceae bacterium]|nr:hypothetical protein [Longimicrobiaceae bacterium]